MVWIQFVAHQNNNKEREKIENKTISSFIFVFFLVFILVRKAFHFLFKHFAEASSLEFTKCLD